ncbi:hypothetical protein G6F56_005685 [Rhizopus delemar]|nr:hypothetical protein G6F56_005685 [Rhizopus delemar]
MFSSWLSSWYKHSQFQEPFNDQYEVSDDDEDWIKVKTTKEERVTPFEPPLATEQDSSVPILEKKLSRQERRAMLRLETKEKKKLARHTAVNCLLPSGPLSIDH